MHERVLKTGKMSVPNDLVPQPAENKTAIHLQDNRPSSIVQKRRLDAMASDSPIQRKQNKTGLPDQLKAGIENLSGHTMDDVKVHYNSDKPAQLNAHAYAQGTDIHLASGQEKHLPHEAWHVVQQKQGRVKPTMQMKGKMNINDDKGLEKEADTMGLKALSTRLPEQISKNVIQSKNRYSSLHSHSVYSRKVFQFALPPYKWETHGLYNATKGENIPYKGGRPIKFDTRYKHRLLNKWQDERRFGVMTSKNGNKEYIRTPSTKSAIFANWVPIEAFQIDHKRPWNKIEKDLLTPGIITKMQKENNSGLTKKQDEASFFGAKMYYHDYHNLQPMQGSENAGKGANNNTGIGPVITDNQLDTEKVVTRKYLSIMDSIQNAFASGDPQAADKITHDWLKKDGAGRKLLDAAEDMANSKTTKVKATPIKKTIVTNTDTPVRK